MLKQRIITAIVLALLFVSSVLWLSPQWLMGLFLLVVSVAGWEWARLSGFEAPLSRFLVAVITAILLLSVVWYCRLLSPQWHDQAIKQILNIGCIWWALALLWVKTYPASAGLWGGRWFRLAIGIVVLIPAWLGLVVLRFQPHGIALLFILVLLVASADIGAYFSGRAWGRAKLAPTVSPGKSWAGFWGGLVCSSCLMLLFWWLWGQQLYSFTAVLVVAVLTSLASVLGDLVESMVKRHQGIKDSSNILPGHGGVLDRIDSLTAAAPIFALSMLMLGN